MSALLGTDPVALVPVTSRTGGPDTVSEIVLVVVAVACSASLSDATTVRIVLVSEAPACNVRPASCAAVNVTLPFAMLSVS